MRFEELDRRMRGFETAADRSVPEGSHIVIRVDGRNFTSLTRNRQSFDAPFDARFRDCMAGTAKHLMNCGINVLFAYSQSDEISLWLHPNDATFGRKTRKLISITAAEAASTFSLLLGGESAAFDSRISELPNDEAVFDYFSWRIADAARNSLNAHCYWLLRREGMSKRESHARLLGMSKDQKRELLLDRGLDFDALPGWQRDGFAIYWRKYRKHGIDPRSGQAVITKRRRLRFEWSLPQSAKVREWLAAGIAARSFDIEQAPNARLKMNEVDKITYTIMPDYGFAPYAWISRPGEPDGGVGGAPCAGEDGWDGDHEILEQLQADFAAWAIEFERAPHLSETCIDLDWLSFHTRGLELARRLKAELGDAANVVYEKPFEDPGRDYEERCEILADRTLRYF